MALIWSGYLKRKALFIWSRVPEKTLPPSYPGRANFSLKSLKDSTDCLYDPPRVVSGGEWASCLVSAGQGNPGRRNNIFSYQNFGSPTRDNSRRAECHLFSKFQVLKHKFALQKQNKLNKTHTDRMNERNSNKERYLEIWILKSFIQKLSRVNFDSASRDNFLHINARWSCLGREDGLGYLRPYKQGLTPVRRWRSCQVQAHFARVFQLRLSDFLHFDLSFI